MAVYSKLLLSTGGGIISTQQQADQTKDTATVLIGLGGTGVHCIRTIKTQVHTRLKPDDEKAVIPSYSHIRFLGVDTTFKSRGGALTENQTDDTKKADSILSLDDTEFFPIANKQVKRALGNKLALQQRTELSWLDYEHIDAPNLTDAGAGGIRQVGRFMMMDRSEDFASKVEQEINSAKRGLNNPRVNVHIFAGLSGGTGSGCFLDVCYMVRSIAERIGGVTIFGYFFLPDVNLSTVPFENVDVRSYIPKNGYAAMQELDYCMGLQKNGGSFEQVYQGHKTIAWNAPPVDMCHLICATDKNNNEIPDAYNYAMNVTTEYVMDFLTDSDEEFGLSEHLANFRAMIGQANAKKTIGSEMAYCVIGASCASIPLREINTYLASELFSRFAAIQRNIPSQADVERLAISSLARDAQSINTIYDSLYREIREGATGEYGQYQDDWKFVRDYGNSEMVIHYTNQTAAQLNKAETNAKSMVSMANQHSLLSRIQTQLVDVLRDINRGPIFAYRMIAASESHNLLNIVDGLIADNNSRWNQEAAQTDLRQGDYDNAKADFDNRRKRSFFDNDEKRFNDYEYYLMLLEQHKLNMHVFSKLDSVLRELRNQIVEITASYYIKLNRVMDTLINTFAENRDALASEKILDTSGSFAIPMMTIAELKKSLDTEIERINVPGMLDAFMVLLVQNEEEWIQEDENKISRMVTDFFVNTAFNGFANKTITSFLKDKYENKYGGRITDEQLAGFIYNDWMKLLTEKASPLFYFNSSIWSESKTSKLAFLSFPSASAPIKAAAVQMNQARQLWGLKESALTDRIFIMCSACGLPLSSYNNCTDYERMFFTSKEPGRHYYEGKAVRGMDFTDWNKLPSITPQSVIDVAHTPEDLAKLINEANDLYDKARALGVLDDDSIFCEADEADLVILNNSCDACEKAIAKASKAQDIPMLQQTVEAVKKAMIIPMSKTNKSLPTDGYRETKDFIFSIQKDHFISAPALHAMVRAQVDLIEKTVLRAQAIVDTAEKKVSDIKSSGNAMGDYCESLFTGVITVEGRVVIYNRTIDGIKDPITLSKRGEEYPFNNIPLYQGFLSYQMWDKEIKSEVKKIVDTRLDNDAPEIYTVGKELKEFLSEDRLTAWAQLAANYEQRSEIIAFLGELKRRFNTHCLENGL